jgi:hypothetical protein
MNLRKDHGRRLEPRQCRELQHAWVQADHDGHPLDALISVRPKDLTPLGHAELVGKTWNRLGVWSRRHTSTETFHAILVRETRGGEHFHVLMHVGGNANRTWLRHALERWFRDGEANSTSRKPITMSVSRHQAKSNPRSATSPKNERHRQRGVPGAFSGNSAAAGRC